VYGTNGILSANLGADSTVSGVPSGQAVLRFYTQFADPSKVSYTWDASLPDSQQAFVNGDLALYIGYASEAAFLTGANPNLDFDVAPLPQPATATTKTTYGLDYAFAIVRGASNSAGAYTVAADLTGSSEQQAAASATGLAPASRAALAAPPANPTLAVAYTSALYAAGWLSPAPLDTDTVFSGMINTVISGKNTLASALASAQGALSALLQ
jgi:spermidine/putrescine-binding protein